MADKTKGNGSPKSSGSSESPGKKPRKETELPAFTEQQIKSITGSIAFDQAIKKQLDTAVRESLQTHLPGMLAAELPGALAETMEKQRKDVQAMLDASSEKWHGELQEFNVANTPTSPAGDSALAAQLQLTVDKFESLEKQMDTLAAKKVDSPGSNKKYCDEKNAELTEEVAASPCRSPSPSIDGASTPGALAGWPRLSPTSNLFCSSPAPSFGANSPAASSANPYTAAGSLQQPHHTSTAFDRAIDPCLVKLTAAEAVRRTEIVNLAKKLVHDAGMDKSAYEVEGIEHNTQFAIRFCGPPEIGARYTKQLLEAQRKSKTEWYRHSVPSPTDSNKQIPVYINPDKSAKTVKGEIGVRRTLGLLRSEHPNLQFICCNMSLVLVFRLWSGWWSTRQRTFASIGSLQPLRSTQLAVPMWRQGSLPIWVWGPMCSGNNSCLPPLSQGKVHSVLWWNARALMHNKSWLRKNYKISSSLPTSTV